MVTLCFSALRSAGTGLIEYYGSNHLQAFLCGTSGAMLNQEKSIYQPGALRKV